MFHLKRNRYKTVRSVNKLFEHGNDNNNNDNTNKTKNERTALKSCKQREPKKNCQAEINTGHLEHALNIYVKCNKFIS